MIDLVSPHPRREALLVVLVNISGHGLLDLGADSRFAAGDIEVLQPRRGQTVAEPERPRRVATNLIAGPAEAT